MYAEAQNTVRIQQIIHSSTCLLRKLTVSELVEKFSAYCDSRHIFLSEAILTESALSFHISKIFINALNAELNPICHLLELVGAHHILHVSRLRVSVLVPELFF